MIDRGGWSNDWSRNGARIVCASVLLVFGVAGLVNSKRLILTEQSMPIEVVSGLDVNDASVDELMLLPGIGPSLSDAIVREREAGGRFVDLDDLTRVKGIGERRVMALRGHAVVSAP